MHTDQLIADAKKASRMVISPMIMGKGRVTFMFSASSQD